MGIVKKGIMEKTFWIDPYQHTLQTRVASVTDNEFVFEKTIAYSFAGGQESDKAQVNGIDILSSRMEGALIYYTLPEGHGLSVGDSVVMTIDWPRRYRLMRLHFAAELILELVVKKAQLQKVGAHISESKARIDFVADFNVCYLFDEILAEYNALIERDVPIIKDYSDVENHRRYWKVDGFAQVPCGGTHVRSTGEVGYVRLKREHPGKSIERIEIRLKE